MTVNKCDRCGAISDNPEDVFVVSYPIVDLTNINKDHDRYKRKTKELCPGCISMFWIFIDKISFDQFIKEQRDGENEDNLTQSQSG